MTYADPRRCPDCRAPITPGDAACGRCGLSLRGETAQRLFLTLTEADRLLAVLRASTSPVGPPAEAAAFAAPHPVPTGAPAAATTTTLPAATTAGTAPRGLRVTSVPQILLALGAGCLLVAALVFLVVTWSVLGVGGRTATLVGLTAVAGGLATWMAHRGLRAAAESLSLVAFGLLTLDMLGADRAGWLGNLSSAGFSSLLGAVLVLTGLAGAVAARRTPVTALTGAEVVAVIGTALVAVGVGSSDVVSRAPSLVLATLLAAAVGVAADRCRLQVAAAGAAAVTAVAWLSLATYALDRAFAPDHGWRALWVGGEGWPLVVAAGLVASPALARRPSVSLRVGALAVAQLLLVGAVLAPTTRLGPTTVTLVALGVLGTAGAATVLSPRPWGLVQSATQAVAAVGVAVVGGVQATQAAVRLGDAALPPWSGSADDRLPMGWTGSLDQPAAWLLPLCVLALVGTGWALATASPVVVRGVTLVADLRVGGAVLAGSVVAAVALYPVPLWLVVGVLLTVVAGFVAWWLGSGGSMVALAAATVFAGAAVAVSLHAESLSAVTLSLAATFSTVVLLRGRVTAVAAAAGGTLAVTLAGAAWSWTAVANVAPEWSAVVVLVVLGALTLLSPYLPVGWEAGSARRLAGLETGSAVAATVVSLAGVALAPGAPGATWTAVYLTITGVVVSTMSLLRPDRRRLAWAGGALLAAASWVRLWDLGVSAPEAYTLPSAVVLVLVGLDRLRRDRSASSMSALAPALSLVLVPSLLWVLVDASGVRPLLLGTGCLLLVMAGARLGWTAPLALGAAAGAVLVLRLAAPYVGDAVPRWVLIGAAGALLIAVGATWERRLAEARSVVSYVRCLR